MRRLLIAANWKMNLSRETAVSLAAVVRGYVEKTAPARDVLLAPPHPYLEGVHHVLSGGPVWLAGQDVSAHAPGAYTGDVAAEMLLDTGCTHVIVGHSERREHFGDTDEIVQAKTKRAVDLGLAVVLCVGEREEERDRGEEKTVVERQLQAALTGLTPAEAAEKLTVAYEPVWAIGTGRTASPADAQEMHRFARSVLAERFGKDIAENLRILYGGSVKPGNAGELLRAEDIDGALVGGASLEGESFTAILSA